MYWLTKMMFPKAGPHWVIRLPLHPSPASRFEKMPALQQDVLGRGEWNP